MRGGDGDVRAEFATDGAGRRFRWIGRAENVADFADGPHAFINQRDALLRAGLLTVFFRGAFVGYAAGHEAHDHVKLVVTVQRAEDVTEGLLLGGWNLEGEFLFQNRLGAFADAFLELVAQHLADRAVKFHRLRYAHVQHLDADDVK